MATSSSDRPSLSPISPYRPILLISPISPYQPLTLLCTRPELHAPFLKLLVSNPRRGLEAHGATRAGFLTLFAERLGRSLIAMGNLLHAEMVDDWIMDSVCRIVDDWVVCISCCLLGDIS